MRRAIFTIFVVMGILAAAMAGPAMSQGKGGDAILGLWLTEGGKSKVMVTKVGTTYTGKIIWLGKPNYVQADLDGSDSDMTPEEFKKILGKPKVDRHNPEAKFRSRPVLGLRILWDLKYDSDNTWQNGQIYNPEDGKTYRSRAILDGNHLDVRGFVGVALFGKSTTWTRIAK